MARRTPLRSLAVLAALALALAGCSGDKEVSAEEVEEQAASQLAAQVNAPKPNVDCPGPLKAEVGATLDCVLTAQGDPARYAVKVAVTSVEGERVNFSVEVGDSPLP